MKKSKNKNKIIGVNTGLFLNPLRELYCNNSILKTGSIVAGIMLASCGGDKDNKNNEGNENKIDLSKLSKESKENLAKQLGISVDDLQSKINELGLTVKDIDKNGNLTNEGEKKKEEYNKKSSEDENNGQRKLTSNETQQNEEKPDDKIKETLKFLGENEDKFINYLDDLDIYFGNKKSTFNDSIKGKDESKIKEEIVTLCEKYVKEKDGNNDVQFNNIIKDLNNKFIENKIKESISNADFKNVKYNRVKDNDKIKVTVTKNNEKVDFYLTVSAEDLFSLKVTKDNKEVDKKLYRIKIDVDGELPKELSDLLVPKDNSEIKSNAETKIKEVLSNSIKTGDKIDVGDLQKLANTLKQFVEAAQNLLKGKYKDNGADKFLADVKKVEDLYTAFGKSDGSDYKNAIKTEYDSVLNSVTTELVKVNSGILVEKINKIVGPLKLNDNSQKIGSKVIYNIIDEWLSSATTNNVINDYIDGCTTAGINIDGNGDAKFSLYFENNDTIDEKGIVAFASANKVGVNEITAINNDFKTKLNDKIAILKFGTPEASIDCKTKISNDYIKNVLKFESLSSIDPADITEEKLKEYCGKANCIVTADDVKDQLVKPVMKEVFGDDTKVKAVFAAVKGLLELKVANISVGTGAGLKTLVTNGLASIGKDDAADAVDAASDKDWKLGTATRLKTALLNIRDKIEAYNNDGSATPALKIFFKFYFGEVGTGTITGMTDGNAVPDDLKWMRLGKAFSKWVFSKSGGYDNEQTMRQNYNDASKALAMSILLNGITVKMYNNGTKDSTNLKWFTSAGNNVSLDLTNATAATGLGGSTLTVSDSAMDVNPVIKVDFDNMIICDKLKTKTSAADGKADFIVIPKITTQNEWGVAQIVAQDFKDNFDSGANKAIKSDFALLALFLGYFKKGDGKMIDIKVKANGKNDQDIYTNSIVVA